MDRGRFDRLTTTLGAVTGRRGVTAGLFAGTVAALGQGLEGSAGKRRRCRHCPQRACCSCTTDNGQTASNCILLETPNAEMTLTIATNLCQEFCGGTNETVFSVRDNTAGLANVCSTDNRCEAKTCPIRL